MREELSRSWPVIGMAIVLWLGVVILRTPDIGIDATRVFAIVISTGASVSFGMHFERILRARREERERKK